MGQEDANQRSSFLLLPAFTVGVYDGINPCNFALALIFLLYLAGVGRTQKRIFWFGLVFIASAILTNFGLAGGIFDHFMTMPLALNVISLSYWVIAFVFLVLGILNMVDWWLYRRYLDVKRFRCPLPVFLSDQCKDAAGGLLKRVIFDFIYFLIAISVAFIVTVGGSIYPQREYIFIVYSYLAAGGSERFALWSFFQYSVALVLPLIIVWAVVFFAGLAGRNKIKTIRYYKGASAALFLAVAVGLGYFLLG